MHEHKIHVCTSLKCCAIWMHIIFYWYTIGWCLPFKALCGLGSRYLKNHLPHINMPDIKVSVTGPSLSLDIPAKWSEPGVTGPRAFLVVSPCLKNSHPTVACLAPALLFVGWCHMNTLLFYITALKFDGALKHCFIVRYFTHYCVQIQFRELPWKIQIVGQYISLLDKEELYSKNWNTKSYYAAQCQYSYRYLYHSSKQLWK